MNNAVEISFDCLPLRTIGRLDIPLDASPAFRARCERIKAAIDKHGSHNSYFLYNARCAYRLTNNPDVGTLTFKFEGTLLTDENDSETQSCDLVVVELISETCDWMTEPIVRWFGETVQHSVACEFDRYIAAGDLDAAKSRAEKIREASDESGGFVGMYL